MTSQASRAQQEPGAPQAQVNVGLLTKFGVILAAIAGVLGPLSTVLQGDQTPVAIAGVATAAIVAYGVIRARGDQNAAAIHAIASSSRAVDSPGWSQGQAYPAPSATPSGAKWSDADDAKDDGDAIIEADPADPHNRPDIHDAPGA